MLRRHVKLRPFGALDVPRSRAPNAAAAVMMRPFLSALAILVPSSAGLDQPAEVDVARFAAAAVDSSPQVEEAARGAAEPTPLGVRAPCEVTGAAPAGDITRARTACERARSRFAELFGDPAPGVRVVLWERSGYRTSARDGVAIVLWPTGRALASRVGEGEAARLYIEDQWRNVLPHETAHALLAARFFDEARPDSKGNAPSTEYYGTPFPDWLDESVAIWAESPENRRGRAAEFRQLPERMRDLRSILAMPHPASDDDTILAMRDGAPVPRDEAVLDFYPQSFAVLAFIIETGGPAAVQELARRLLADSSDADAIVGLPGLPADFQRVSAAWDEWVGN